MHQYNTDPYETLLVEQFRKDIDYGRVSIKDLERMISEGNLTEAQIKVIEELAPSLGGLGAVAKQGLASLGQGFKGAKSALASGAQKVGQGVRNVGQGIANSYNAGKDAQAKKNAVSQFAGEYKNRFSLAVKQLGDSFPDPDIQKAVDNLNGWVQYIQRIAQERLNGQQYQAPVEKPAEQGLGPANPRPKSQGNRKRSGATLPNLGQP